MKCGEMATFRYTWPGRDEAHICVICAQRLRQVALAMGLHIQLIPLSAEDHLSAEGQEFLTCPQEVNGVAAAKE